MVAKSHSNKVSSYSCVNSDWFKQTSHILHPHGKPHIQLEASLAAYVLALQCACFFFPPFITLLVCEDGDKTVWQKCQWGMGRAMELKLNRKLCTSIKTWGRDIKSCTPVPGGSDAEKRRCNGRRQFNQNLGFSYRDGGEGVEPGRRERRQDSYV